MEHTFHLPEPSPTLATLIRRWVGLLFLTIAALVLLYLAKHLGAAAQLTTMVLFAVAVSCAAAATRALARVLHRRQGRVVQTPWIDRLSMVLIATALALVVIEGYLWVADTLQLGRSAGADIPEQWRHRETEVAGAKQAYFWHGHLFVVDEDGFRRSTAFPPRQAGTCRIVIFGDSLTYGAGVALEDTYPARLEASLRLSHEVEVLNLGVSGASSEDVRQSMARWVEPLEPDLVIYGVCLNDYLPTGVAEYETPPFPLIPTRLKVFMASRTRLGLLVRNSYKSLLINLGLEHDFFDDILRDYGSFRTRFAADLKTMNQHVTALDLPSIVMMVVTQSPNVGSRGHQLSADTEIAAKEAGLTVVSIEDFTRTYDGRQMSVSQWEGHPNEVAHGLFADLLEEALKNLPALDHCRLGNTSNTEQ